MPYYYIVVADARSPRDGKFIERLGSYNPNTNPATIELNQDKALNWLEKGAQPTDTARAILSYKGVLYKKHLNRGVAKGAITEDQANTKFAEWLERSAGELDKKVANLKDKMSAADKARLEAEAAVNHKRSAEILERKKAAEAEAAAAAKAAEEGESTEEGSENEEAAAENAAE